MLLKFSEQVIQTKTVNYKGTIMRIKANELICNLMKQVNNILVNSIPLGINRNTLIN